MRKLKFIYLVLLSFGLILFVCSAEVNALEGWEFHEESSYGPDPNPDTTGFYANEWWYDDSYGVNGYWRFDIQFELENNASLEAVKVVTLDDLAIGLFIDSFGTADDNWLVIDAYDYFDEMDIEIEMIIYGEADEWTVDISDKAYDIMTSGIEFEKMYLLYPGEKQVYRIDFVFGIDFYVDLTSWEDLVVPPFYDISNAYRQYGLELYYNPSDYYHAYEQGLRDGYDSGYDDGLVDGYDDGLGDGYDTGYQDGYDDGILESDVSEAYQKGYQDGEKSKIAENNAAFYSGIEKWLVPAIITVIILGGFVTIAVNKRREQ